MAVERSTLIVSVNANADEEMRLQRVEKQVGDGWRVVQSVPVEAGTAGPGHQSADFMRLQVTLERDVEPQEGLQIGSVRGDARDHD